MVFDLYRSLVGTALAAVRQICNRTAVKAVPTAQFGQIIKIWTIKKPLTQRVRGENLSGINLKGFSFVHNLSLLEKFKQN